MRRTRPVALLLKVLLPAAFVLVLFVAGLIGSVVYKLTHPHSDRIDLSPADYQEITQEKLVWSQEKWRVPDGLEIRGWLIRSKTSAPLIILSHGLGQTRSDLLRLGLRLWSAGYNVLLYDLRGHGDSGVKWSGLGEYEGADLQLTIKHLRGQGASKGGAIFDASRIGLYGVGVGGYASLIAAPQSEGVRAVVADSVYPDVPHYIHGQLKETLSVNNRLVDFLVDQGLNLYLGNRLNSTSAREAVRSYQALPLLMLTSGEAGELRPATGEVFMQAVGPKQILDVPHSRFARLYGAEAQEYDRVVIEFFKRADVLPVK